MNSPERSPKRQRISLSPASPPYHLSKQESIRPQPQYLPQTPQSPVRMSADHGSVHPASDQEVPSTATIGTGSTSDMPHASVDPTDSADLSQDVAMTTDTHTASEGATQNSGQDDTVMSEAADHRRTDHERNESSNEAVAEGIPLLCQTPHPTSSLHPSTNLISLYSLSSIASSVARKDPLTGEKINKLRKSYEGKAKNLSLPGRNKPTSIPGELLGLMEWPDEGWYDQRVYGKELSEKALEPTAPMMMKLGKALSMNPGRLPSDEHEKWKGIIGIDDVPTAPVNGKGPLSVASAVRTPAQAVLGRAQQPATTMRSSAPASPRGVTGVPRPDRQGKKRRYDDASFEGYGEGGAGIDDDGYSTGGIDDRRSSAGRKRRRDFEQHGNGPTSSSSSNNNSNGTGSGSANGAFGGLGSQQGMVGVRSS